MRHYNYLLTWDEDEKAYRGTCNHERYKHLSHFDVNPFTALHGILDLVEVADKQRKKES